VLDYIEEKYECQAQNVEYVTNKSRAWELLNSLLHDEVYALDFETTSLFPWDGEVRLTTIVGHGSAFIIDHFHCGKFYQYAEFLSKRMWAVFNSLFEGNWIDTNADNDSVILYDVGHMRKAKLGGGPLSLAIMCKRDLSYALVKDEQNSNWADPVLSQSQILYAGIDGLVTWDLWSYWLSELTPEQWNGFLVINDAWRGTLEMEQNALQLDVEYHKKIVALWKRKHGVAERYLRKFTPPDVIPNINSKKQISDFLKAELDEASIASWPKTGKTKQLNTKRKVLSQAAHRLPYPFSRWMAALVVYNYFSKYLNTYGDKLIWHQETKGYIPTKFNMAQAITCRYSSSAENLQNIPRSKVVRRSFIPPNGGFEGCGNLAVIRYWLDKWLEYEKNGGEKPAIDPVVMVMADYSSIEVRVLAELSGDERLLHDAIYGDVHSRSASQIFGIDYDYFVEVLHSDDPRHANAKASFKDMRSRAKGFTFQLLYGAGAAALALVLRCSDEDAAAAIDAWAALYPKAYHYRTIMFEKMQYDGFLPVCDGRTIFVFRDDRTMPVAANYPVQGAAASVMYRAVYHAGNWVRHCQRPIEMCCTVHDELILYSRASTATYAKKGLEETMVKGWLDIFPNTNIKGVVEGNIGTSWGDK
jgi:DNA polymerase I-like protein with 3'-5' exonuclease and polymerase domains